MKIIATSLFVLTFCIQNVFAEQGEILVECPNPENGIDCTHEAGLGELDCKASFKVTFGNKEITITPTKSVRVPNRIYQLNNVKFTQHSALLNSIDTFLQCSMMMKNGDESTPIDFSLSWAEVEQEVKKIAPNASLNQRTCGELSQGAKCTYEIN